MIYPVQRIIDCQAEHGESSWWDDRRGIALFMDCWKPRMWTYDPEIERSEEVELEFNPMAVIGNKTGYLGVSANTVYMLNDDFRIVREIHRFDLPENCRFNDCKCGPDGALYLGVCGSEGDTNSFLRLRTDGTEELLLDDVGISNGFAWSRDQKTLFYTDTIHNEIYSFDYTGGNPVNKRVVYKEEGLFPDGMCIDENDNLWTAFWGIGKILNIDTSTGTVINEVSVGPKLSSSCVFGGKDMNRLFITTSRLELTDEERSVDILSGGMYMAELPVKGLGLFRGEFE